VDKVVRSGQGSFILVLMHPYYQEVLSYGIYQHLRQIN